MWLTRLKRIVRAKTRIRMNNFSLCSFQKEEKTTFGSSRVNTAIYFVGLAHEQSIQFKTFNRRRKKLNTINWSILKLEYRARTCPFMWSDKKERAENNSDTLTHTVKTQCIMYICSVQHVSLSFLPDPLNETVVALLGTVQISFFYFCSQRVFKLF